MTERCMLCPRRCGARRTEREGAGVCGMGTLPVVARAALHFWEEPCISGTRGSGAVFFTGCPLHCLFCQNEEISTRNAVGKALSPQELAGVFRRLVEQGAETVNLVTATHFVPAVAQALRLWRPPVPVVYNCGGYESVETLRLLEGLVDVYLPDMKYASPELAARCSGAPDYVEVSRAAVREMLRQTGGPVYAEDGILRRGTMIRPLILPGYTRDSTAVLDWIAQHLDGKALVSLMAQYIPCGRAVGDPEFGRRITAREARKVQEHLFSLGLDGFVQDRSAATAAYLPSFRLEGL